VRARPGSKVLLVSRLYSFRFIDATKETGLRSEPDLSLPLIDPVAMAEWTTDLDPDDVAAILAQVPGQCEACVCEMQEAVNGLELVKAKRVAHKLKGMASNLGAARLARLARSVELESQDLNDVAACLPFLSATVAETIRALPLPH
jgi:HPt (histidine-containing phosphotransfer) domain-containing protein